MATRDTSTIVAAFEKNNLIPVIIQEEGSKQVRMLGYMNLEAYEQTMNSNKICFFSRSKNRLWVKGEESGNYLFWKSCEWDCDNDTILFQVRAVGPTCHTGDVSCFTNQEEFTVRTLEGIIDQRLEAKDEKSYVFSLSQKGVAKVAQKVGEEAVETVIEAMGNDDKLFLNESADLLFHYLMLLKKKGFSLKDIEEVLAQRHQKN
ncbi:MAG: bifunctional phosphoribosyl-AMP cyclohydrolase/phosphoribosyl-ATP diphosphatase HisIE [Crocinitomicaceae bacterium]|jgi:phosphoribosyl-ATP pyrophosphohydrolase/phosphoribosyl-AMP cyclohydrolase|nr:bifunctional phosphoribosyl-AMP cyclohydrolase/phosphoribosyl-ATP diphosphatase HisIE [Crocinitomicaceae bacterium]